MVATLTVHPLSGVAATEAAWGPPLTVWLNSGQYCQPLVSLLDFALETKCSDQLCVFMSGGQPGAKANLAKAGCCQSRLVPKLAGAYVSWCQCWWQSWMVPKLTGANAPPWTARHFQPAA